MYHAVVLLIVYSALIAGVGNMLWTWVLSYSNPARATALTKFMAEVYRKVMPGQSFNENELGWGLMATGITMFTLVVAGLVWPVLAILAPVGLVLWYKKE